MTDLVDFLHAPSREGLLTSCCCVLTSCCCVLTSCSCVVFQSAETCYNATEILRVAFDDVNLSLEDPGPPRRCHPPHCPLHGLCPVLMLEAGTECRSWAKGKPQSM